MLAVFTTAFCFLSFSHISAQITGANIIKFNLTSFAVNHYTFQYERVLSPKHSLAVGFGFSGSAELPFKDALLDQVGDDPDAINAIESMTFSKITITPEYRFYVGSKEAPLGFYVAPFIRYTHMTTDQVYEYTPSDGKLHTAPVKGTLDGIGGGAMIGIQWALGKKLTLDWWIAGPFYGVMNGEFHGTDSQGYLTPQDALDLEEDIESVDIPLWTVDATVSGVGQPTAIVDATVEGPYYGLRAFGFALGFRF